MKKKALLTEITASYLPALWLRFAFTCFSSGREHVEIIPSIHIYDIKIAEITGFSYAL